MLILDEPSGGPGLGVGKRGLRVLGLKSLVFQNSGMLGHGVFQRFSKFLGLV